MVDDGREFAESHGSLPHMQFVDARIAQKRKVGVPLAIKSTSEFSGAGRRAPGVWDHTNG
jgi:hypothetical protein